MFNMSPVIHTIRCACLAAAVLGLVTSAHAQSADYKQMVGVADLQGMVTQRMTVEALLVALDVDRVGNLMRLQSSRDEFDGAMSGLHQGLQAVPLSADGGPEMISRIEQAQDDWQPMDALITNMISGQGMTAEEIGDMAEQSLSLQDAVEDLAEVLLEQSKIGGSSSMLGVAVETASITRMLSQQMTKEFLLIAYGHQADRNRYALRESSDKFLSGMQGLLEGDYDRLLLAAPTSEIRAQLHRVERIWEDEYRPLIERAMTDEELTVNAIAQMAWVNQRLLQEIDAAAVMYGQL